MWQTFVLLLLIALYIDNRPSSLVQRYALVLFYFLMAVVFTWVAKRGEP